jgi:hypothetical protein
VLHKYSQSFAFSTRRNTTYTDVGSAENAGSNFQPTYTDVGSAENAGSNFQPTYTDVGSAENAGSNFQPTYTDVGSAENAGSNFLPCYRQSRNQMTLNTFATNNIWESRADLTCY